MHKKRKTGFAFQMIQFMLFFLYAVVMLVVGGGAGTLAMSYVGIAFFGVAAIYLIFALIGRKYAWADIVTMIISIPFLAGVIFGIFGLLGSIFTRQGLKADADELAAQAEESALGSICGETEQAAVQGEEETSKNADFSEPAAEANAQEDAGAKPMKQAILDRKCETISVVSESGQTIEIHKVDYIYSGARGSEELYTIVELKEDPSSVYILVYDEKADKLFPTDTEVAEKVFAEWKEKIGEEGKRSKLVLDLYDTIVHKKEWKEFRRSATQEELAVLAIGSKYRLSGAKFFVKAVVSVIGVILSVVLGITLFSQFGLFSLFILVGGYLFFNLMASKLVGYSDTYSSCKRKLSKEYRAFVNSLFRENAAVVIFREIVLLALMIFTLPYKFLLIIIETLIPSTHNWTVAHGGEAGAVISIPKGYDVGGLGEIGAYYASCSFEDAWDKHIEEYEKARLAKFSKYEYTDQYGVKREAYSDDGKNFFTSTDKLTQVGTSSDDGKTIDLK